MIFRLSKRIMMWRDFQKDISLNRSMLKIDKPLESAIFFETPCMSDFPFSWEKRILDFDFSIEI